MFLQLPLWWISGVLSPLFPYKANKNWVQLKEIYLWNIFFKRRHQKVSQSANEWLRKAHIARVSKGLSPSPSKWNSLPLRRRGLLTSGPFSDWKHTHIYTHIFMKRSRPYTSEGPSYLLMLYLPSCLFIFKAERPNMSRVNDLLCHFILFIRHFPNSLPLPGYADPAADGRQQQVEQSWGKGRLHLAFFRLYSLYLYQKDTWRCSISQHSI